MYFINQVNNTIGLAKFIFGIYQYQAVLCGNLRAPGKNGARVLLQLFIIIGGNYALF